MQPDREALGRDALVALDRRHLWHPFTQTSEWLTTEPLMIERAEGFHLIDVDGRRYLDGVSSLWCNVHGHGRREIVEAVRAQLDAVAHTTMLGLTNVPATVLAKRLIEAAPKGLQRVFYSDAGATAVEIALKMAFEYCQLRGESGINIRCHFFCPDDITSVLRCCYVQKNGTGSLIFCD